MGKKAAAALAFVLALVLAGCSVGTQAQEEWGGARGEETLGGSAPGSSHDAPESVEPGAAQAYLDEVRPVFEEHFEQAEEEARDGLEELRELRPPEELRPLHEELVSAYEEALPAYRGIAEAAGGGDDDRLDAAVREHLPEIEEFNAEVLSALRELQQAASEEDGTREGGAAESGGTERERGGGAEAGDSGAREVTLRIEGSPGTRFSGTCAVGSEEHAIGGRVPREFAYDLGGQELDCEIRKESAGAGTLEVVLLAGSNVRSVQQTNAPGGTINLTYANSGLSSSTSSTSRVSSSTGSR